MCRGVFPRISRYLAFLWRTLLISSGEVLKFDLPETLGEPNGIPTSEAMHCTLPFGDHAYVFPQVDETGVVSVASPGATHCKSELRETLEKDDVPLTLYAPALARDIPRAQSVVRYIHVSALLARTRESLALSDSSNGLLGKIFRRHKTERRTGSLPKARLNQLGSRNEQVLAKMAWRQRM